MVGDSYMAGMLHDAGKLILAANFPEHYGRVIALAKENQIHIQEAEEEILGTTHGDVGAHLLGLWGLSDPIVEAIAFHHNTQDCSYFGKGPLAYVHAANALTQEDWEDDSVARLDQKFIDEIGLGERVPLWREKCLALDKAKT